MKYRIVSGEKAEQLEAQVNAYLEDGWKLVGGVTVSQSAWVEETPVDGGYEQETKLKILWAQAIVKLEP